MARRAQSTITSIVGKDRYLGSADRCHHRRLLKFADLLRDDQGLRARSLYAMAACTRCSEICFGHPMVIRRPTCAAAAFLRYMV